MIGSDCGVWRWLFSRSAVISALAVRRGRTCTKLGAPHCCIALVLVAGVLIYSARRSGSAATIVGVVRATEVRVEPR